VARHEDQAQYVVLDVVDLRGEVGLVELLEDLQMPIKALNASL